MCSTSNQVFAWIGAILVNIGFISLITWGAATYWLLGFFVSALYTLFLFGLARWLERRGGEEGDYYDLIPTSQSQEEEGGHGNNGRHSLEFLASATARNGDNINANDTSNASIHKLPILVSLLFGLAVISEGVTSFFLPVNLVPTCYDETSDYWRAKWKWTTNVTNLPEGVRDWATNDNSYIYDKSATFGYIAATDITLFRGSESKEYNSECVWSAEPSKPPMQHKTLKSPSTFVAVSTDVVCFQASARKNYLNFYCSDGRTFLPVVDPTNRVSNNYLVGGFMPLDGILWFKETCSPQSVTGESGTLVFSLDPDARLVTLHSERVKKEGGSTSNDCDRSNSVRLTAIVALFTTAIPLTLLSLALWKVKQIPSMGVATYVGFTTMYLAIYTAIQGQGNDRYGRLLDDPPHRWWFALSGLLWLVISSHLCLTESMVRSKEPLRWGLMISGIAFLCGMSLVIMDGFDTLWHWILLNFAVFVPLMFFGAVTDTVFLVFLGALGFLADSARFAGFVGDHMSGQAVVPVQFLIFALSGLGVGAIGYQLREYQGRVKAWAKACVQNINDWLVQRGDERGGMDSVDAASTPLSPPSTPSQI